MTKSKLKTRLLKDLPVKTTPITDEDYVINSNNGTTKLKVKDITKHVENKVDILEDNLSEFSEQLDNINIEFDKAVANITNGNENATNSEIVQARGEEINLNVRLNKFDLKFEAIKKDNSAFKQQMNEDFGNAKTDYFGEEHLNIVERLNSDFDNVHQRINDANYLEYEGSNITADNSYYGYTKEMNIKGRTLQNLTKQSTVQGKMEGNTDVFNFTSKSHEKMLKPNTEYTIILYPSRHKINAVYLIQGITTKLNLNSKNMALFTTKQDISNITEYIHFYTSSDVALEEVEDTKVMLLEGDYTNVDCDIPFIEGIKSVGENDITQDGEYPVSIKSCVNNVLNTVESDELMICYADAVQIPYKSCQESVQELLLNEPLRSLPNGVYDEITEDGIEIRRVGKIVLDDNDNYNIWGNPSDNDKTFNVYSSTIIHDSLLENFNVICNTLPCNKEGFVQKSSNSALISGGKVHLSITKEQLDGAVDVAGVKEWLKQNPTTLYYELAEPIIIKHNVNMNLKTYDGTTHITSDNYLQPKLSCKIPSNVQAVVSNLKEENKALNTKVSNLNLENEEMKETNATQDELINTIMMATDEMYLMLEPLLTNMLIDGEIVNPLVNMYVAMVKRGLKTKEKVPEKHREQVKKILDRLEKYCS